MDKQESSKKDEYDRKRYEQRVLEAGDVARMQSQKKVIEKNKQALRSRIDQIEAQNMDMRREIDVKRKNKLNFDQINARFETEIERLAAKLRTLSVRDIEAQSLLHQTQVEVQHEQVRSLHSERTQIKELRNIYLAVRRENMIDRKSQLEKQSQAAPSFSATESRSYEIESPRSPTRRRTFKQRGGGLIPATIEQLVNMVSKYETEYARILEELKSKDLGEAATLFVDQQKDGFALYKLVNELITEVQDLENQHQEKLEELEKFQRQNRITEIKMANIQQNSASLVKTEQNCKILEDKLADTMKLYQELKTAIPIAFKELGLDIVAFSKKQLDDTITEMNIWEYLTAIEEQASKLSDLEMIGSRKSEKKVDVPLPQELNLTLDKLGEEFEVSRAALYRKDGESKGQDHFLGRNELIKAAEDMKQSANLRRKSTTSRKP